MKLVESSLPLESLHSLSLKVNFLIHRLLFTSKTQARQSFPDEIINDFPGEISI
jgi:hypothetical protein